MDSLVRAELQYCKSNDKKTAADFLGSQQKLGRRFEKDASIGMSGGCAWHKGGIRPK
jgi:hypothetical protein